MSLQEAVRVAPAVPGHTRACQVWASLCPWRRRERRLCMIARATATAVEGLTCGDAAQEARRALAALLGTSRTPQVGMVTPREGQATPSQP